MSLGATVNNSTRRMTGRQAMNEMLKLAGIGPIFGMGGFHLLPFYEACRVLGLRHTLINDERCGAFAADAYAKVTHRPGLFGQQEDTMAKHKPEEIIASQAAAGRGDVRPGMSMADAIRSNWRDGGYVLPLCSARRLGAVPMKPI